MRWVEHTVKLEEEELDAIPSSDTPDGSPQSIRDGSVGSEVDMLADGGDF